MSQTIALVAGAGTAGFRDGRFTSALFNNPLGLAIRTDGTILYVADAGNNRIRAIHLDQDNKVTTLVGQDTAGSLNGALETATFNRPQGLYYLPGDRLVVNDAGNNLLRLVDLKTGIVSTLAGGSGANLAEGPATQVSMGGVWDMAYVPETDVLLLTQPAQQALKRLDLKNGKVTYVLHNSESIPYPYALCETGGKLYLADHDRILVIDWKAPGDPRPVLVATLATNIQFLSENGGLFYALNFNDQEPLTRLNMPSFVPVTFVNPFGDAIPDPGKNLPTFKNPSTSLPVYFVPDPRDIRKFYIVNPTMNIVTSFRDLFGNEAGWYGWKNSNGLNEPEYPTQKPPRTFRILFCGDSRSCAVLNYPFKMTWNTQIWNDTVYNLTMDLAPRQVSLSKRMETELNTIAAVDELPFNFEVLNLYHNANNPPLILWPYYEVPGAVQKNDIDLVVIFQAPPPGLMDYIPFNNYFTRPITPEGIPAADFDPEYVLKPLSNRIPEGEPRRFFELCKSKKLVFINGNNFSFSPDVFLDPALHDLLVQLYGKPYDLLNRKLSSMKTSSGKPVRLLICSAHTGPLESSSGSSEDPKIWPDLCKKYHIPFLDLNDEMTALSLSFFPLTENAGNGHFNPNGHLFFSQLLIHDFIRDGFIPTNGTSSSP
jgi:hypothetical protein